MESEQLKTRSLPLAPFAWVIMLLVSILPNIIFQEIFSLNSTWLIWVKVGLLVIFTVVSVIWKPIRPLRNYFIILLAIFFIEDIVSRVTALSFWQNWFGAADAAFTTSMFGTQFKRFIIALLIILVLFLLQYKRKDFFLVRGQVDAPVKPVKLPGFPNKDTWTSFGGQFAIYISLGTLVFLILGGRPTPTAMIQALPMLPAILLFASINAFYEGITYRSALLAPLEPALGYRHALGITAIFFGIGHFYGVPYGVIGVIMSSFLGWFLGKAVLETRGFFWAWFIHFLQDVLIFSFMAIGSIVPGG
ncbi:MAG: CPBP family intramembrane metalloprotease [Anaerolineaceae bacterium]|nr:CPBP family intramembrane metalloprotease [Anaerolineaceae bacterium]